MVEEIWQELPKKNNIAMDKNDCSVHWWAFYSNISRADHVLGKEIFFSSWDNAAKIASVCYENGGGRIFFVH